MESEIREPIKEPYEQKEIIGETSEVKEAPADQPRQTEPPPDPNSRFKAIVLFDSRINETFGDLLMPPQYSGTRVLFVKKGKISALNFDKLIRVDTTQYLLKEGDDGYTKPEDSNGQEQANS